MKILFLFCLTVSFCSASALTEWFSKPTGERGAIPSLYLNTELESPEHVAKARAAVWQSYREGAVKQGWDKAIPQEAKTMEDWLQGGKINSLEMKVLDKTMLYTVITKGEKPAEGWPIIFCLHGGGGNPRAKGPHSWPVNTSEWLAQMKLTTHIWEAPGLYIIPRMADDREGRWYYGYNQIFIDRLIQQAILFKDANPDRIFIQGISEGGYAGFRLGSLMADRWAGSCAMAAAEPLHTSPPENMRHVAFRCGIGENDTMFNRAQLARDYFKELAEFQQQHPGQYINHHDEQKGRGHGIDYKAGPAWIAKYTRTAVPTGITWTVINQHDRHRNRLYWLALDGQQETLPLKLTAEADKAKNTINITAHISQDGKDIAAQDVALRVYLNDTLADLSKEVVINVNGKEAFKGMVQPSLEALIRSTAERGDPKQVFAAQVKLKL